LSGLLLGFCEQLDDLIAVKAVKPVVVDREDFIAGDHAGARGGRVRQGLKDEDAEDITQEVFLRVCQETFLKKADQIRGKFRTVLLAVTKHVIASWRRHELAGIRDRRREVSMEGINLPDELPSDADFDRLWVQNLMAQAMERLKTDPGTEALKLQLEGLSYQEIAAKLGRKTTDVTNYIHRAKDRLKKEFERLIAEYSTRDDVAEEIAALRRFL